MGLRRSSYVAPVGAIFCVIVMAFLSFPGNVDARAVNISNTWILPEEGFPVFYRYFRDRISWYEADAVCQFHHANLVTVDTTAQYDAARAYLKELDIMSNVWIGLIKSNEEGDFTWTDYKPLSGEGYWASAPVEERAPLCAALDPARDYRWGALSCGGPQVASFICELPVPAWALKAGGCLIRSIPSLTVQFLPELAAVQLISDCGLDGTKKVTCKSNESHADILKELSCAISEEDFSDNTVTGSTSGDASSGSPRPSPPGTWGWSHTADIDPSTTTTAGDFSTRTRRETVPTSTSPITTAIPASNKATFIVKDKQTVNKKQENIQIPETTTKIPITKLSTQHSFITDSSSVSENPTKASVSSTGLPTEILSVNVAATSKTVHVTLEKEITVPMVQNVNKESKPKEHHDIFTLATDHFIPPLVMAKSKLSADMTVVSPETKHLQTKIHQQHQITKSGEQTEITKPTIMVTNKVEENKSQDVTTVLPTTTTSGIETTTQIQILNATDKTVTPKPKPLIVKSVTHSEVATQTTTTQIQINITTLPTKIPMVIKKEEDNMIDYQNIKLRKPGKGKKYDKSKEEKKKYKDITTESTLLAETTHKVVALTIPSIDGKNSPLAVLEITTKISEPSTTEQTTTQRQIITEKSTVKPTTPKIEAMTSTTQKSNIESQSPLKLAPAVTTTTVSTTHIDESKILIDPNIMKLNKEGSFNNESENIHHAPYNASKVISHSKDNMTQEVNNTEKPKSINSVQVSVPKNNSLELNIGKGSDKSEETTEPNPDPLPRPNRSRTLTQPPQHRSFYPYFFNRVLG